MIVVLSGGVGGAKLVLGMSQVMPPEELAVIANTGDDFTHLGLCISPDLDTLMYTLSGEVNPETGWGRKQESWQFMDAVEALGGETWFRLGDRDLATHIERTRRLSAGATLSNVTVDLCQRFGIESGILPMTDDKVRTRIQTDQGELDFQDYFVRRQAKPRVSGFHYSGAQTADPSPAIRAVLAHPGLRAIVLAPSNPYLSIDPILAIPAICQAISDSPAPVLAISPIVGGAAIKGPTAKIMTELGDQPSAVTVARHYQQLLDGFILDTVDCGLSDEIQALRPGQGMAVMSTRTVMRSIEDKTRLARFAIEFADSITKAAR